MTRYAQHVSARETPQSEPIRGENQVQNSAGGYVYAVDDWLRLDRFLILGAEGGTYYATERALTRENAAVVERCLAEDAKWTIERIAEISESGRAPKNTPAIFALAIAAAAGSEDDRRRALAALPRVCRTGTHLFQFVEAVKELRGGIDGRLLRRGIAAWYENRAADKLAYQLVKYRQRESWTHRGVMALAHPSPLRGVDPGKAGRRAKEKILKDREALFHWATRGTTEGYEPKGALPELVQAYRKIANETDPKKVARVLERVPSLPWEAVPSEVLGHPEIWKLLLPNLPMTALIRNLGRMTANGALKPLSRETTHVFKRITDESALVKARVHPIQVLSALETYMSGSGARGKLSWEPIPEIARALDAAFYLAFATVEPTGSRFFLGLDVSGSMDGGEIAGVPGLTPRMASTALAMVTVARETRVFTGAFTGDNYSRASAAITPLSLPTSNLKAAIYEVSRLPFGGTDCALPMLYAREKELEVDAFVIYTDNETWAGGVHPSQALREYRKASGIPAKLVVVGMTATEFSIANPKDAGMLDVVGFDTATPSLIADFAQG